MPLGNYQQRIETGLFKRSGEQQSGIEACCNAALQNRARRTDFLTFSFEACRRKGIAQIETAYS